MKKFVFVFLFLFLIPLFARAENSDSLSVSLFNDNGEITTDFFPFGKNYRGVATLASGDMGTDGTEEIIIGSGPGLEPLVKIFRQDGSLISEFFAYEPNYQSGITVAVCDLNSDGLRDIVTGTMSGGGPHIRIFSTSGEVLFSGGYFAYAGDFRGGANVACGDVDGDGEADIITGAGLGGGPHIKVFDPYGNMKYEVFAGSARDNTGATVSVGDVNGDGNDEIITGRMGVGEATVHIFDLQNKSLNELLAFNAFADYQSGISVIASDINNDGKADIGVSTSKSNPGIIKFFDLKGSEISADSPLINGNEQNLVVSSLSDSQKTKLLIMSSSPRVGSELGKYIRVDLSEQKLYAYENGILINSFLVSTGVSGHATPVGKTTITDKLLWHDYVWSYGVNNPNNYNLPDVKYNLRFRNNFYIHYAYWHNNFGKPMSHGCVNVNLENSEWIYNWSEVGTTTEIVE